MGTEQSMFLLSTLSYYDHSARSGGVALFYYNMYFSLLGFFSLERHACGNISAKSHCFLNVLQH